MKNLFITKDPNAFNQGKGMKSNDLSALIGGLLLVVFIYGGAALAFFGMSKSKNDFEKLATKAYETAGYKVQSIHHTRGDHNAIFTLTRNGSVFNSAAAAETKHDFMNTVTGVRCEAPVAAPEEQGMLFANK